MALSAAHKEAYARAQVDVRHMMAVTISNSAFGTIRLVNHTSDLSVDGDTYTATAMEVREPPVSTEAINTMAVRIDGVSGLLQPFFYDASQTPEPVLVTLKPFGLDLTSSSVSGSR